MRRLWNIGTQHSEQLYKASVAIGTPRETRTRPFAFGKIPSCFLPLDDIDTSSGNIHNNNNTTTTIMSSASYLLLGFWDMNKTW